MDKKKKEPGRILTFRAPPDLIDALEKKTRDQRISYSLAIRQALEKWVEEPAA